MKMLSVEKRLVGWLVVIIEEIDGTRQARHFKPAWGDVEILI